MTRGVRRALAGFGVALLGLIAALGLLATAAFLVLASPVGRRFVTPHLVAAVDDAIAGSLELESFAFDAGAIVLRGLRVRDPDGAVVVAAMRASAGMDLTRLRLRTIGVWIELDDPAVLLDRDARGELGIARAFAPARPSRPPVQREPSGPSAWTVRVTRLAIHRGAVRWIGGAGDDAFALDGLELDLAGEHGPAGSRVALRGSGALRAPADQPVSLEGAASLRQGEVAVSLLRAKVGETAVDLVGEGDLATQRFRAAALSFAVSREGTRAFAPRSPLAGDLAGAAYAESDGTVTTVALQARTANGATGGAADAVAAVRLADPLAVGFDVAAQHLDPARLLAAAPAGDLTFTARGHLRGTEPRTLQGAIALRASPSRLRGGRVSAIDLRATARAGTFDVERLVATLPGARLEGAGRYALSGALSGRARLDAPDLATAVANAAGFAGTKAPALRGAAQVDLDASGTLDAPVARIRLRSPRLALASTEATAVALAGDLGGSLRAPRARLGGTAATLTLGGRVVREVSLGGTLEGRTADARLTGLVKEFGTEPVTLAARGTLSGDGAAVELADLAVSWPGSRFALAAPARLTLAGPRVDRLALENGTQRLAIEGGLVEVRRGRRRVSTLDARVVVERFDFARLPPNLLPPELGLAGTVSLDAVATGPVGEPRVDARVEVADATLYGLAGLALAGDGTYDGATRRAKGAIGLRRAAGGAVDLRGELPVALGRAPAREVISVSAEVRALPLAELLRVAGSAAPLTGTADLDLAVLGTIGAPALIARAALHDGRYGEQGPFAIEAALDAPGRQAQLTASLDYHGARAVELGAGLPLDTSELLRQPGRVAARLPAAALHAKVVVPGLDLALLRDLPSAPPDLAGVLSGDGTLTGTLRAPRGELGLDARQVVAKGWREGELHLVVALGEGVTAVSGRAGLGGQELVSFAGSLFAAPEGLAVDPASAERAQLEAELTIPGVDLSRIEGTTRLAGTVKGRLRATGTLQAPTADLSLQGQGVVIAGRPLGDVDAKGRAGRGGIEADARLAAARGGVLTAAFGADVDVGIDALRRGDLSNAPARLRVIADRVNLGFLPAVLPGTIRTADGELGADVSADGTLSRLRPIGTVHVTEGRMAIAEMGEWTGIGLDATLSDDELKISRLEAQRGRGRLDGKAEASGLALRGVPGKFTAELRTRGLAIPRGGQDIITLDDVEANATGTFDAQVLRAELRIPHATVRLPKRSPRTLQTLDRRDDIVIGKPSRRQRRHGEALPAGAEPEETPYRIVVHTVVPNRLFVRSDNPRVDIELKADATFDVIGARVYSEGTVDVIRGEVEPIGGRRFQVERGKVTFTGGPPTDAVLDVVALYDNPSAKVTVTVSGPTSKPQVKMTSEPPMDEGQIAMLIATGRTQFKAGGGGVGTLTGEEAGKAALGVLATQIFKDLLADKLPLDTVAVESSQHEGTTALNIRAGKYLTDKIYVGYTRSFEAQLEKGENQNEVRVEYQISRRWTFESRYGDGKSGGASLIWSKDY